ncbi:hypothetical protein EXN66_Car014605 [Channa argus]|uniref:Uncharacterized protein n=1 Tax=Channa argus TaxID=215402 RepID=A0A6G1Q9H0_CHAAH|nr:hypothetical protein EXN66_Car014605 [Channa argus]
MLKEIQKNPRAASQTLQVSLTMLNVKVQDSTFTRRLNKYSLELPGENLFCLKRT